MIVGATRLRRGAAVLLSCVAVAGGCSPRQKSPERIVLIVVDTLRRDHLSIYGGTTATPNMDRLARSGTVFRNALASFHQTTMSMGAMFTGRTPSIESNNPTAPAKWIEPNWCGMARFGGKGSSGCIPESLPTLGQVLRDRGYWTAGIVSNRLLFAPSGFERGFDEWVEVAAAVDPAQRFNLQRIAAGRGAEHVNVAVREVLARRPSDRFFLYVHYMDSHDWGQRKMSYAESVAHVDRFVGELIDDLEDLGLLDGSVVILTADHGEALGEGHFLMTTPTHFGNPSFEAVLEIPLIVVGADLPDGNEVVRTQDLFSMISGIAGATISDGHGVLEPGELFLSERAFRTYRAGRWKSFIRRDDDAHFLVDLEADPGETRDVADEYPQIVQRHRRRMEELSAKLSLDDAAERELTAREADALRALGYLEPAE